MTVDDLLAPVLTIDGPSGSGKGTVARAVAHKLGWHFLDSGALYRAVGLAAGWADLDFSDSEALARCAAETQVTFRSGHVDDEPRVLVNAVDVTDELRTETAGAAASAQTRTGNIFGKVLDPKGNPLPGVSVTLVSPMQSPVTMTTAKTGTFRFLSLPPGADYSLRLERKSFRTRIDTGIRVKVGVDVRLNMTLEPGEGKETASAPAEAGMIDRKTWSGTNVTQAFTRSSTCSILFR